MSKHITRRGPSLAAFTDHRPRRLRPEQDANWAQGRGPDADGFAPKADPPLKWDDKTNIKWKAELPGRGTATPIVWGDNVFVVAAEKTDRVVGVDDVPKVESKLEKKTKRLPGTSTASSVLCFDRKTGKPNLLERVATEKVPHEGHHPTRLYAAGSPTTDGKLLYVSFGSFGIYWATTISTATWKWTCADLGRLSTRLGWGEAVTPVLHGNDLVLNWDQEENAALIVLDAKTGATRREEGTRRAEHLDHADGRRARRQDAGHRQRHQARAQLRSRHRRASLAIRRHDHQRHPVGRHGRWHRLLHERLPAASVGMGGKPLDSRGELDAKTFLWQIGKGTPYVSSPLLTGSRLVFLQANAPVLTILDRKAGKVLVDRERLPEGGDYYASPSPRPGGLHLVNRAGDVAGAARRGSGRDSRDQSTSTTRSTRRRRSAQAGSCSVRGEKYLWCIERQP